MRGRTDARVDHALSLYTSLSRSLPRFAAVAAALIGLVNIASALTPNIRWRGHLLLEFEPVQAMRLFHAFALPAGTALLMVAPYLARRRRRAWQVAIALMVVLGALDLLKGLDFEETTVTWATAALLYAAGTASASATTRSRCARRSGGCLCWGWSG